MVLMELKNIVHEELNELGNLLNELEKQHKYIAVNDVIGMEGVVPRIESTCRSIARIEVKRREITGGKPMTEIINSYNDMSLDEEYRNVRKILQETMLQKDNNESLLRQGLGFTTRMLSIINPDRSMKTYNNYGKVRK